jgi:hypothetical protein
MEPSTNQITNVRTVFREPISERKHSTSVIGEYIAQRRASHEKGSSCFLRRRSTGDHSSFDPDAR